MKNHKCRVAGTMIAVALAAIQSLAQSTYEPYTFTTLAGGGGFISLDEAGSAARFAGPFGMAVDSAGNVYVADFYFNTIRIGYPPPRILDSGFSQGQFVFNLTGPPGQLVVLEASSDLVSWLPVWTKSFTGALNFSDPQGTAVSKRFYRAHLP